MVYTRKLDISGVMGGGFLTCTIIVRTLFLEVKIVCQNKNDRERCQGMVVLVCAPALSMLIKPLINLMCK